MKHKEIKDILISWVALSIAFMLLFNGITLFTLGNLAGISLNVLLTFLFLVAVSFLSHEFGHRQVARRYGFQANYEMWPVGVILAVFSSLFGFLIAAPGAVVIRHGGAFLASRKKLNDISLKISISGIAVNLALGILFAVASFFAFPDMFRLAASINFWLAFFNLLPIAPLDGSKVLYYSKKVWAIFFALSIILFFLV
ncbi:MAG: metalloprotease [Candidatus Aenigmarchaeota archaeon]|nr:metalloprotease [Candidatus Aenigmarchaeota archaeon]